MIPWTVFYLWDNRETSCVAVGEISAPHSIKAAKAVAEEEFVGEVITMIPGCHMKKTYLFTKEFENGTVPFLHVDGDKTSSI
tara:strand:+ start:12788 stop:13033 length:246 start_codon:yes stop_codon:yes gene_type:complete